MPESAESTRLRVLERRVRTLSVVFTVTALLTLTLVAGAFQTAPNNARFQEIQVE